MNSVTTILCVLFVVKDVVSFNILERDCHRQTTISYIEMNGYPAESHYVTTSDGYILNLHRIPTGRNGKTNGKVVFLEHGLWTSSYQWVITGPEKGLAFILADAGYDVWMGNTRGTTYSRNHTTLNPDTDSQFWKFSWHEIGIYDLPASIDYVLMKTNLSSLYYAGHSQGTTSMYVLNSVLPEYNNKIKFYVHLAPIAYMNHLKSPPFRLMAAIQSASPDIIQKIFGDELFRDDTPLHKAAATFCALPVATAFCENILFFVFGFSPKQTDITAIPEFIVQFSAGSATMQFIHYLQVFNSDHFRQYDYGNAINLEKYGKSTPPDYDLSKITAPGYLIYAANDWVSDNIIDVPKLYDQLGNCVGKFLVPIASFNHLDHLIGISATDVVYSSVLTLFDQH